MQIDRGRRVKVGFMAALAAGALAAGGVQAGTANSNLTVQATVLDGCSAGGGALSFGNVDPATGTTSRVSSTIAVTCTLNTPFAVALGDGLHVSGGQRRMRRAATTDYINYELYKASSGTDRFGDITAERVSGLNGLGAAANTVSVYGAVPSGQSAGAGAYSDTVVVTIHY